jgi:purine nucleosidase
MTPHARTVVVDQDGGVDDALALLLLARTPGVVIAGVGSVHGNVRAPDAALNALRVLELLGDHTIPVAVGAAEPLAQPLHLAHPENLLRKITGPSKRRTPTAETAAAQIVRLSRAHPGEIDLLALGPLTNIALALRAEPDLPRLLRRVVVMGGAVHVRGNISPSAESNFRHDPDAAQAVIVAGFDLTLVPLDLTRHATVTRLWAQHLAAGHIVLARRLAVLARAVSQWLPAFPLHDALAAAILLDPTRATCRHTAINVDLQQPGRGRTRAVDSGKNEPVAVVAGVDSTSLLKQLVRALGGRAP